ETARGYYERALFLTQHLELQRSARIVLGYLGILHFDAGQLAEAERYLDSATAAAKAVGDVRVEGFFEGVRGAVLASADRVEEARAALDLADKLLEQNAFFAELIDLYRGHLALALAPQVTAQGDGELA